MFFRLYTVNNKLGDGKIGDQTGEESHALSQVLE